MKEIFKDIKNYEGIYQISNFGSVKNKKTNKILKPYKNTNNYLKISLWKKGKRKDFLIHKLVAQAFIENTNDYMYINHKDENKKNNCVDNLEWCTSKYNCNYGTRNLRLSSPVICVELRRKFNSIKEASDELKIYYTNISHCCSKPNQYKTAGGYHWRYAKEE